MVNLSVPVCVHVCVYLTSSLSYELCPQTTQVLLESQCECERQCHSPFAWMCVMCEKKVGLAPTKCVKKEKRKKEIPWQAPLALWWSLVLVLVFWLGGKGGRFVTHTPTDVTKLQNVPQSYSFLLSCLETWHTRWNALTNKQNLGGGQHTTSRTSWSNT